MAIPTVFRQKALSDAEFQVQVKIQKIPLELQRDYDLVQVEGVVMMVFKAAEPIDVGSVIEFDLPVAKRAATGLPMGGMFCSFEDVLESRHIEVCLNRRAERFHIAADLFEVIGGPVGPPAITLAPVDLNSPGQQMAESRSTWWQRWISGRSC